MNITRKDIRFFFHSQAFADGIRTTAAILLPALVFGSAGWLNVGMTISLGALCVSLADAPGPIIHKRNGMIICALFVFVVSLLTTFCRQYEWVLGLEIVLLSFFFSMFNVYGNRAAAVGNAAILVMILIMDKPVNLSVVIEHSLLILFGGTWYLSISLIFNNLQPYRGGQRALGECIREVASYLAIKAGFYNPRTDLDQNYQKLVTQQVVVHEKQDAVREILFKTRQIVKESTTHGRKLIWTFVETVDLFEDITAIYYDYASLRKRYEKTGILEKISVFINRVAAELDEIGLSIQNNSSYRGRFDFEEELLQLKVEMDALPKNPATSNLVLKKIVVNLRRMVQRYTELVNYFEKKEVSPKRASLDHSHFVGHQPLDPRIFWNNISMQSSVFRHSLRVAIACAIGYGLTKALSYGQHSYWVLLTIAFIMKPAFSLAKQRNIERIIGTVSGGFIGVLIVLFIHNSNVLFAIMVIFMISTYSFARINYLAMVVSVTPFILILFSFMGMPFLEVVKERVGDTVVGCAIAFSISYFLFPTWESEQIRPHIQNMLQANRAYLEKILEGLKGRNIPLLDYKLVRKEVYVNSANLSAAFQRMLSEPKTKQKNSKQVHQFVVLNHILFSNLATLATTLMRREPRTHPTEIIQEAKKSLELLKGSIVRTEGNATVLNTVSGLALAGGAESMSADDALLKDQLIFIYKLILDIDKSTAAIYSE